MEADIYETIDIPASEEEEEIKHFNTFWTRIGGEEEGLFANREKRLSYASLAIRVEWTSWWGDMGRRGGQLETP